MFKNKVLILVLIAFFGITKQSFAQGSRKPNIILIMTDQHQAQALSIEGNKDLKTPNLDKLAENGTRFKKAYVTFPLCTPSRSSIFTGKMPHTLGINSNEKGQNELTKSDREIILAQLLQRAGYDCAYGGKWHAHESDMVPGNGFEMIAPMGDIGLAEKTITYLKSKKEATKPFFLTVSFDNPHTICEWARNEPLPYGNIPEVAVSETPQLPKNHAQEASFPESLKVEQEANKLAYPTANYTEEDWRQYRYSYYKLIEKVDVEIGKILRTINDLHLDENTLILFTSDHGDGNASHGWNQKTALIEETVKVPFIASFNGKIKTNAINTTLISNGLDLYPTICEYAGIEIPKGLLGKSLKSVFEKPESNLNRDFVVVETKFDGKNAYGSTGRAVVGSRFKYVLYNWGKNREQLFDLEKDPLEMNNLVRSKEFQTNLDDYRSLLYQWCKSTNDRLFLKKIILPKTSKISSSELFDKPY
jgi:arylsulfatase A-like enzyme